MNRAMQWIPEWWPELIVFALLAVTLLLVSNHGCNVDLHINSTTRGAP